jgi:glucose/mannose-6-phosphate isomerase
MNLDSLTSMKHLDKEGVYLSISSLPDQMHAAWSEVPETKILPEYKLAQNVVIAGMGGSALAGRTLQHGFLKTLRVPVEIVNGYHLPHYVNEHSLVIVSSYSGNTEETISQGEDAVKKRAMVYGITTGGKLAKFIQESELSGYIFDPKHNPSGQPRMSLGYSLFALLSLFHLCGFISITEEEVQEVIQQTRNFVHMYSARTPRDENHAKALAYTLKGKVPLLVTSEHLFGIAHAFKNQLNENAKTFSMSFDIPELNHHLLEGLRFPPQASGLFSFIFFSSNLYDERVQKRYAVTSDVVEQNYYSHTTYELSAPTRLGQICEMLTMGSYVSFYMAMLQEINPAPIPWVDYFKEKLSK